MKYIIAIPDGVSDSLDDYPKGNTPMQLADTPLLDQLANCGEVGWAKTVPDTFPPGSDVACLSIFGYDPAVYYTGRAPLEAVSMGIELGGNVAFRCNLVTIENGIMKDFTAGHISTEEARDIIQTLQQEIVEDSVKFYPGVQYRHAFVTPPKCGEVECTPPHDITGQPVDSYLPKGIAADAINEYMEKSRKILAAHPVNQKRIEQGKNPATQVWLWGQGTAPQLIPFSMRCGLRGAVISAVDLIKGIALLAGLDVINVTGATGLPDTNYEGKGDAAIDALKKGDFVCIHVEATDEMGHQGDAERKKQAFSDFDRRMLNRVVKYLKDEGEPFRLLVTPDHPTPIALKTHSKEPVPFLIYDSRYTQKQGRGGYSELAVKHRSDLVILGHNLLDRLCEKVNIT
ncbi:cofactor-independent phosphoglycerate mutase [bacterium]|nr:cofactor-independent phosphoglycerate mutase [bacterium]